MDGGDCGVRGSRVYHQRCRTTIGKPTDGERYSMQTRRVGDNTSLICCYRVHQSILYAMVSKLTQKAQLSCRGRMLGHCTSQTLVQSVSFSSAYCSTKVRNVQEVSTILAWWHRKSALQVPQTWELGGGQGLSSHVDWRGDLATSDKGPSHSLEKRGGLNTCTCTCISLLFSLSLSPPSSLFLPPLLT